MSNKLFYVLIGLVLFLEVVIALMIAPRVYISSGPVRHHQAECSCLDCDGPYNIHLRDRPKSRPTGQSTGTLK